MIYLDNAATTFPKPPSVYENTFQYFQASGGNPGRGAHQLASASAEVLESTRRKAAAFFQISNFRRVIFTYNCTDSINMVLKGLLNPGDHVIASNLDHNSVSRPLESVQETIGVQVTRIPFEGSGQLDPAAFRQAMRRSTRLMVLTHGSNVLGSVQPLEPFRRLARETGVPLLVDAAQTAGRVPLGEDSSPVFFAFSAHKALFGMPGLGVLIVPADVALRKWREGGSGTSSEIVTHPEELPMRLEAGTPNFVAIVSLLEGIRFIEEQGMSVIHRKELELADGVYRFLSTDRRFVVYSRNISDGEDALPILSFNIHKAPAEEVAAILDRNFQIAVRSGLHCAAVLHAQLGTSPGGCIRMSPGFFNRQEEMETAMLALNHIADAYCKQ